ncbi:DMT family transporter [Tranquillimonas alkanivorans]|uniref:S-adenosylmethionine uptake transporter n=1 Tax=Tranquillimonas alkanivorans TaxID=441119 RepID=A0A1I5WI64_9RHOB|nr:DMT family transporter [Tranquillimonas alkanivorans]SFQ19321.1 S-adenosylmethionine uptake transporter [Tranquillimonas alkanivorans]
MAALTPNLRGALLMMGSMTGFTLNDVCMKALSDELPLFQALFLRGLGTTLCLALLMRWQGRGLRLDLSPRDRGLIVLRSVAEVVAAFFFLTALFNMPIANATAILQAMPLSVTLAGALFLGEAFGWRRMAAILIGFCGVLLIVRPGAEGFNVYSLYALAAVAAVTVRDLAARRMSAHVPSLVVALAASALVTASFGIGSAFVEWGTLTAKNGAQLLGAMGFVFFGYIFSVAAMRSGEIGFVAPFRYTGLIVALVAGLAIFGEWPSTLTLLGSAIVVATGVFTLYRDRVARPPKPLGLRVR